MHRAVVLPLLLLLLLHGGDAMERLCGPQDYVAKYGECDGTGGRSVEWTKSENSSCTLGSTGRASFTTKAGCLCSAHELRPALLGTCEDGEQPFKLQPSDSCSIGMDILEAMCPHESCGTTLCPCTEEDMGSTFTPCDENNQRRTVFFWTRKCEPGALQLPPPGPPRTCDSRCFEGEILAPPHDTCQPCPAGTSSSSAVVYKPPWVKLPDEAYSFCATEGCSHWRVESEFLASRPDLDSAYMKLWVNLKSDPAYLKITYRIVGKLYPSVGEVVLFVDDQYVFYDQEQDDWTSITVDLQNREYCLWTVEFLSTDERLASLCAKANHIIPYNPALSLSPAKFRSRTFDTVVFHNADEACNFTKPERIAFGGDWVVVVREVYSVDERGSVSSSFTMCAWEDAVLRAQEQGAQAVLFLTARDQVGMDFPANYAKLDIPIAYISDEIDEFTLATVEAARFVKNQQNAGSTEVLFVYDKLVDFDPSSSAHIQSIEIHGTKLYPTECTECPAGSFAPEASPLGCMPCPENEYAPAPNFAACLPCPGTVSSDRASCFDSSRTCSAADYRPNVGECRIFQCEEETCESTLIVRRNLSFYAHDCIESGATKPAWKLIACEACPPGEYRDMNLLCDACPAGLALKEGVDTTKSSYAADACTACAAGTGPIPTLSYPGESHWLPKVTGALCERTECPWSKDCAVGIDRYCWRAAYAETADDGPDLASPLRLVNGVGLAAVRTAREVLTFTDTFVDAVGSISFSYAVAAPAAAALAAVQVRFSVFSVDDGRDIYVKENLATALGAEQTVTVAHGLSGVLRVSWEYAKLAATDSDVIFSITAFSAVGCLSGGASQCDECPVGMVCHAGSLPVSCPSGTTRSGDEASCGPCSGNTVAPLRGSSVCAPCGKSLVANEGHTACVPNATCTILSDTGHPYNLELLGQDGYIVATEWQGTEGIGAQPSTVELRLCPDGGQSLARKPKAGRMGEAVLARSLGEATRDRNKLTLHATAGDRCESAAGEITRYSIEVTLICAAPSGLHGELSMTFQQPAADKCQYYFSALSPDACPVCTADSWTLVNTNCSDGLQQQSWHREEDCQGDPPDLPPMAPCVSAESDDTSKVWLVVGVTVPAILLLTIVVWVLYKRSVKLEAKYAKLSRKRDATPSEAPPVAEVAELDDNDES
ncbi:hypothetical protein DIPPA_15802 [Diplonema papillatum]|nr:hypothetical protein DIPPA_15802 [Diplonema papillatum]